MDAFNPRARTVAEYMAATPAWRTDLYAGPGTLMTLDEAIVMKQFEWDVALGDDQGGRYRCPLHVGFRDPSAPPSSAHQKRAAHIYRFQVWLGDTAPPPIYKNEVRRNWVYESGIISGGTSDPARVENPRWGRAEQRERAQVEAAAVSSKL